MENKLKQKSLKSPKFLNEAFKISWDLCTLGAGGGRLDGMSAPSECCLDYSSLRHFRFIYLSKMIIWGWCINQVSNLCGFYYNSHKFQQASPILLLKHLESSRLLFSDFKNIIICFKQQLVKMNALNNRLHLMSFWHIHIWKETLLLFFILIDTIEILVKSTQF